MNSNKKLIIVALILLVGISAYFVWSKFNVQKTLNEASATEKVSVRMKWFFAGTMSGWFAGKEQNIYKENGIDLTINSGGPDNSSIKLVAAGTDIFGVAGADEVLIAREKGIPVVPIAVLFKESPIGFISKSNSGIKNPSDWYGKTIEVDFGSNAEIQFRALIKKFKVKNIKEVPYTYSLVPFIENKVDVSVAYVMDQVVTLKNQGIDVNVITSKEYGINPYGDVIFATEKTLKEKPELVAKFLKATIQSQKWAVQNDSLAVTHLVKNVSNLKFTNEIQVWRATIPFLLASDGIDYLGKMKKERWEETQNVLLEFGALKNKQNLEY
jgi:NitT/TauT family transport system substrate-binding protein